MLEPLKIDSENELELFLSHLDHCTIMNCGGQDVGLRDSTKFPDIVEGKYDLRVVESLLI
jgi:hypothetical protein